MRDVLFFGGISMFALGVWIRTLVMVPWEAIALVMFVAILCVAYVWFEKAYRRSTNRVVIITVGLSLALSAGLIRAAFAPQTLSATFAPFIGSQASFAGAIVADPDVREKNQQLVVLVREGGTETRILVLAPLTQTFRYGETVRISGELEIPTPFSTDTGRVFRYDHYLAKKGIFSDMPQPHVSEIAPPAGVFDAAIDTLFEMKHAFMRGLSRALPAPYDTLADGLLTGDQHGLSDALVTMLSLSGLIWVVVLSGYHVTIIAEGIVRASSFLPRRFALLLAGLCISLIVFATGASAPSLRGSIMAGFALFAQGIGRRYDALRALAVTLLLLLLWNPLLLAYDQGFDLSLIVTPALILGSPLLQARLIWIKSTLVREVIAVSVIAQLACLPLIMWQEGQVEVWAIPANFIVTAFVPLAMLLSVIAGFAGIATTAAPLAPLLGFPSYCLLYGMLAVARIAASLPYAGLTLPPFSFIFVVLAYAALIAVGWWMKEHPPKTAPSAGRLIPPR
ncbi:MAG: ComEC/Rec2 family competence protein [Candidatus Pacebacteria bacterium]|nr:ComEC/Rec2 family competence protein [Candidatus Paceibacterota bacterium]